MINLLDNLNGPFNNAKIRVIGVGGCGGNAINNMIEQNLTDVTFIAANTDKQVLDKNLAHIKLQIGKSTTNGLGAGGNPEIGKISAEESIEEIKGALTGSDMVIVTAGMGGGTGTGAAPIVAKVANELGALVVGIVTKPFSWEGKRLRLAEEGITALKEHVDALITIPNQKLLDINDKKVTLKNAFIRGNEVLFNATRGISDIITKPGLVNVDFADVKSVMKGMGDALMGIGIASGENRAIEATKLALNSPLLDNISIAGAKGVLVNITGSEESITLHEVAEAVSIIEEATGPDVNLIHGVVLVDEPMEDFMVTVVATGFDMHNTKTISVPRKIEDKPIKNSNTLFSNNEVKKIEEEIVNLNKEEVKTYNPVLSIPKGQEELKKYDIPAYARRFGVDNVIFNNDSKKVDNPKEIEIPSNIGKVKSLNNLNQPAFIRKMMD